MAENIPNEKFTDAEYWKGEWEQNNIKFHLKNVHP